MTKKQKIKDCEELILRSGFTKISDEKSYYYQKGDDVLKICISCNFKIKHYKYNTLITSISKNSLASYLNVNFAK